MGLSPGARRGPYEVIARLGAGGMGEVYRARDTRLQRDVAVKVLPADVARDADRRTRFEREARAVAALSHPTILAIHDFGVECDELYVVTELLDGESLADRLQQGALPVRKAVEIAVAIARGLGATHEKGIAHRDLKPANVFLLADGQVKDRFGGSGSRARAFGDWGRSRTMVDREIFSRRLEALHGYVNRLRAFRDVEEAEFVPVMSATSPRGSWGAATA
jgi:serine/threonine protein kinase